ncbi:MAG: hypothetical protein AAF609_02845 [Cyanobacteria bacterium P01_C01_bin.120]
MSATEQARALMQRHHHSIKQRQQSLLGRVSSEVGMPAESAGHWSTIQGKPTARTRQDYARSGSALS